MSAFDEYTFYLFTIIELLVTHAPSMHTLLLCTVGGRDCLLMELQHTYFPSAF